MQETDLKTKAVSEELFNSCVERVAYHNALGVSEYSGDGQALSYIVVEVEFSSQLAKVFEGLSILLPLTLGYRFSCEYLEEDTEEMWEEDRTYKYQVNIWYRRGV